MMKIERISVYGLDLPFKDGAYRCRNRTEYGFVSTLVEIETDCGLAGWGEVAPLGAFYFEAFAGDVRAGLGVAPRKDEFGPPILQFAAR